MKKLILFYIVVLTGCFAGCTRDNLVVKMDQPPIHDLMGPNNLYHTLQVTPASNGKALSADFMQRWKQAEEALAQRGSRQLKSFILRFNDAQKLTLNFTWLIPGGEQVTGIFNYQYSINDKKELSLSFVSADENAETITAAIRPLKEDYFEKYPFRIGWIDDKIPGSKDILAAYYRTDSPDSYFYGVPGVHRNNSSVVPDRPLVYDLGIAPKPFAGLRVTGADQLAAGFKTHYDAVVAALQQNGGRTLKHLTLIFTSNTDLTATFEYTTSTGATSSAIITYTYSFTDQGEIQLTFKSGNTNAIALAPYLQELTNYLEQNTFRMDWIDDRIPGSRNTIAAWYNIADANSFFHGELQKLLPLYMDLGFGKTYTNLTITPETPQATFPVDFQERWDAAKDSLFRIGGAGRTLRSFRILFISATQLTITFTYGLSSGSSATGMFTYSYNVNAQGLMKLTSLDAKNANGNLLHPAVIPLLDEYFAQHFFRIDWFNAEHTLAAYYRADEPATYFLGTIN